MNAEATSVVPAVVAGTAATVAFIYGASMLAWHRRRVAQQRAALNDDGQVKLRCSFCGKTQDEVRKLVAGPKVYICDECIDLCNDIIAEECDRESGGTRNAPPAVALVPYWVAAGGIVLVLAVVFLVELCSRP